MDFFLYSSVQTGSCQISCTRDYHVDTFMHVAGYPYVPQHRGILLVLPLKTLQVVVLTHKVNHYLLCWGYSHGAFTVMLHILKPT